MAEVEEILKRITVALGPSATAYMPVVGIPIAGTYRWIVPNDGRAARAVMREWSPHSVMSRLAWIGLRAAAALVKPALIPGMCALGKLPRLDARLARQLCGVERQDLIPVAYIGTRGPQRKAVCHLVGHDGAIAAVVKVALSSGAWMSIEREARLLTKLAQAAPGVNAPRPFTEMVGVGLTSQSWIPGKTAGRKFTYAAAKYLASFINQSEDDLSLHLDQLRSRISSVGSRLDRLDDVERLLEGIDGRFTFPSVWQHGDFAPWNIRVAGSSVVAIDWEDGIERGFPVWDVAHFFAKQGFLFGDGVPPYVRMLSSAPYHRYLRDLGLTAPEGRQLFQFYCMARGLSAYEEGDARYGDYLFHCATDLGGAR